MNVSLFYRQVYRLGIYSNPLYHALYLSYQPPLRYDSINKKAILYRTAFIIVKCVCFIPVCAIHCSA